MTTPNQQLLSMLDPQQARLLDQQMRDQQVAQRAQGGGMLSGVVQAYTGMGDLAQRALGASPAGANEMQALQAQKMAQAEKAKNQQNIDIIKKQAENVLYQQKNLDPRAVSGILKNVQTDPTGDFAKKVVERFGIPTNTDPSDRYKVAGNKVFDTQSRTFINDPSTSKDPNKTIKVNLEKETGLDEDRFTEESWKAATDIMIDPNTPLTERLVNANKVLVIKDEEMNPELEKYLVKQLETYDPKGLENRFSVINDQARLLNDGIVSGFGANALTTIASIGARFGVLSEEQAQILANTQTFDSNAGNLVAEVIKAFGAGTGLSDADREYATKIAGGLITLEEISLKKILEMSQRRAIAEAERYNRQLSKLGDEWMTQAIEPPRFRRMTLKEDPYIEQVDMGDGVIMYIDTNPDGYTNEIYDANGYLVK